MESEARLAMIDGGLPIPELQYEVVDGNGELETPRLRVAGSTGSCRVRRYGLAQRARGDEAGPPASGRAADIEWVVLAIVFEDVRYRPWEFVGRIDAQLRRARAA